MRFASKFAYAAKEEEEAAVEEVAVEDFEEGLVNAAHYQAETDALPSAEALPPPPAYGGMPAPAMPAAAMPAPAMPAPMPTSASSASAPSGFFSRLFSRSSSAAPLSMPAKPVFSHKTRSGRKQRIKKATTNLLAIGLETLAEKAKLMTGDPAICTKCKAVFSQESKAFVTTNPEDEDEKTWTCEFCNEKNELLLAEEEMPAAESVDYLIEPAPALKTKDDGETVIFCIDTSGSMCVTTEIVGKLALKGKKADLSSLNTDGSDQYLPGQARDRTYVTRLQCVQAAIDSQVTALLKHNPKAQVGLVCFSNDVQILGDGTKLPVTVAGDDLNNYDKLLATGASNSISNPLAKTHETLSEKLWSLEESGTTALGPGLVTSLGMLKGKKGRIILCTDGLANVGVGSMDDVKTDAEMAAAEDFFRRVGLSAKESGTTISVISIEGSECKMENLGLLSDLTGGDVDIVNPVNLTKNFQNILATTVVATHCILTFKTHEGFVIIDEGGSVAGTTLTREVGTATTETEITFGYRVKESAELKKLKLDELKQLPFQVQIQYTRLDGARCLRVITKMQSTTTDRALAEEEADIAVLRTASVQKAGHLAQRGSYAEARNLMMANQKLMHRAVHSKPMPKAEMDKYSRYLSEAAVLDDELKSAEVEEKSSSLFGASAPSAHHRKINRKDKLSNAIWRAKKGK